MGTVYRESFTKPLPPNAELFTRKGERFARWKDRAGKARTASVTTTAKGERIVVAAATYTAKYRNGAGRVVKVATGCKTLDAARAVLVDLETRADKVRSNKWTSAEDAVLDHQSTPIDEHAAAYMAHLATKTVRGRRVSAKHRLNVEHTLTRIVSECRFKHLRDLSRQAVERWVTQREAEGMAARTINTHLSALTAFGNWCIETSRLVSNPFTRLSKADERADRRRQRRALTEGELVRLLKVARLRPVAEYGRETVKLSAEQRKGRRTWTKAGLTFDTLDAAVDKARASLADKPDRLAALERAGRERALIYKALVLTGLRKGELASLTVGQLELDAVPAYAVLDAADEKAGRGADIPLRADIAADLRQWLADKLDAARADARAAGDPIPAKLPPTTPLFNIPTGLIAVLDRDLTAADIPKRDDRGRTVDVHALRHTFGTHLSKGGVAPRTAQAAMRHGSIDLTMNTYTDPKLLDVAGALDVLPTLPLDGQTDHRQRATGTNAADSPGNAHERLYQNPKSKHEKRPAGDGKHSTCDPRTLVPTLVPDTGNRGTNTASPDQSDNRYRATGTTDYRAVSADDDATKTPLSLADGGGHGKRATGLEPATFSLEG